MFGRSAVCSHRKTIVFSCIALLYLTLHEPFLQTCHLLMVLISHAAPLCWCVVFVVATLCVCVCLSVTEPDIEPPTNDRTAVLANDKLYALSVRHHDYMSASLLDVACV